MIHLSAIIEIRAVMQDNECYDMKTHRSQVVFGRKILGFDFLAAVAVAMVLGGQQLNNTL